MFAARLPPAALGGPGQSGREGEASDLEGAGLEECLGGGFERTPGRQDVVDEADPTILIEASRRSKCAAHVVDSSRSRE